MLTINHNDHLSANSWYVTPIFCNRDNWGFTLPAPGSSWSMRKRRIESSSLAVVVVVGFDCWISFVRFEAYLQTVDGTELSGGFILEVEAGVGRKVGDVMVSDVSDAMSIIFIPIILKPKQTVLSKDWLGLTKTDWSCVKSPIKDWWRTWCLVRYSLETVIRDDDEQCNIMLYNVISR